MDEPVAELEGLSIVLRGHFNPAIITPGWLLAQKLLNVEDFTDTQPQLITPDVSSFQAPWHSAHVTSDLLQFSTSEPTHMEPLRDLVIGVLRALPHTPVAAMGINHDMHFQTPDVATWHAVGDALAPKDLWDEVLHLPGTLSLKILGQRDDDQTGTVHVTVEPSSRITPHGVYVGFNDHFALAPPPQPPATRDEFGEGLRADSAAASAEKAEIAIQILTSHWMASRESANRVLLKIKALAKVEH